MKNFWPQLLPFPSIAVWSRPQSQPQHELHLMRFRSLFSPCATAEPQYTLWAAHCTCQTNKGLPMSLCIVKAFVTCTLQHWQQKAVLCQYCWYLNSLFLFLKGQTILAYNCNGWAHNFNRIPFLKGSLLLLKVKMVTVNYGKNHGLVLKPMVEYSAKKNTTLM